MAKFQYRMQNILNLKQKMEDMSKNQYAIAKAVVDSEDEKLSLLYEKKENYEMKLRSSVSNQLIIVDIMHAQQAVKTAENHIVTQKQVVERAKTRLEIARSKMNEAMIERKTHDKLKENAFLQFKNEIVQIENKEVDELVSYKYNKSSEEM
ncbi:MAG: flagellar export protein FliJ [bacterium]|nr:flagellar export protein FliJ [bacterium]